MADINDVLSNLNSRYEEVTDLVPDMRVFVDDFDRAKNEYGKSATRSPLGSKMIVLGSGKYLWVGIDGAIEHCRNVRRYNSDFTLDETFSGPLFQEGNNGFVRDAVELPNGKIIIVGHFGEGAANIMRLNSDGSQDVSFSTDPGFDNNVLVVRLLSDGGLLVGGAFNSYNGTSVGRLVKLASDGTLDETFVTNASVVNNNVYDIKVDSSGKIYVAGDFNNRIIRLNSDGTTDESFDVGSGFNNRANSLGLDSNGKLLVGGWFDTYKGVACSPGIVRLETNGDLDSGFTTEGAGLDDSGSGNNVQCLAVQGDNKVLVGGWFNQYDGNRQGHIIRLNADGTKDETFVTGYGFGDDYRDWEGQRVQSILLHSGAVICVGSLENYGGKALYGFAKLGSSGELDSSKRLFRYTSFGISDGYDDMYDGGNFINTNRTQLFDNIAGDEVSAYLSIPNTHTAAINEESFESEGEPTYEPPMDGRVEDGDDYFGEGSSYFTNFYPGMFVMVATNMDIEEFSIGGDLGSDDDSEKDSSTIVVNDESYTVFVKVNKEGSGGEGADPSVNHIIIVPGGSEGLTQVINEEEGDDADDHCIRGLTGRKSIAYLLVARSTGDYLSYEDAEAVAVKFLDVIGGMSSTVNYSARGGSSYDLSPQFLRQVGEGSMDTAIMIEDGERISIQRAGYYELVDANGNRKIVYAKDGESWDDAPEVPEATDVPTGHPTFGANDKPTITEQVIPVGNPLMY